MGLLFDHFSLGDEREGPDSVVAEVDSGIEYTGTNLWILVFAIFIASLGLNVNSTAVVIGAMLVSPLMGPIMGLGLGMATNDLSMLRKAVVNYSFALVVGLATSTVYFFLSPLSDASTEILARTSPNVYDVLIALFGGFAGILAICSKKRANVVPGVAIATALMPPLCAAGYGLANGIARYFLGALYLFVINTVFIALATLVTARFLKFPYKQLPERRDEVVANRVVWLVVLLTLIPSVYFAYDIVKQNQFRRRADHFISKEAVFPNDYLLKKAVDGKAGTITLTFGGDDIASKDIEALKTKLSEYGLDGATLEIKQGFAVFKEDPSSSTNDQEAEQLSAALQQMDSQLTDLKAKNAAIEKERALRQAIFDQVRSNYPAVIMCSIQQVKSDDSGPDAPVWAAVVTSNKKLGKKDRADIGEMLKTSLSDPNVQVYFDVK